MSKSPYWHGLDPVMEINLPDFWPWERGIHVTSIVPPAHGWPVATYCRLCKETTFLLVPWAAKPKDGDYHLMRDVCLSEEYGHRHNLEMARKKPAEMTWG